MAAPEKWPLVKFLSDQSEISKTRNKLPHWQQEQSTYFVTFRLKDSIPLEILNQWKIERDEWKSAHPSPWTAEIEMEYHRRFSGGLDQHLDAGMGSCLFRHPENAEIMSQALHYFDGDRYLMHASVIMPNHVHLLCSLTNEVALKDLVTSWKRFTARVINQRQNASGTLWQRDYFDRLIRDWDHFMNVARYIRKNPRKLREGEYHLHLAPWVTRLLS